MDHTVAQVSGRRRQGACVRGRARGGGGGGCDAPAEGMRTFVSCMPNTRGASQGVLSQNRGPTGGDGACQRMDPN